MKTFAVVLFFLFAYTASASDAQVKIVQPKESTLKLQVLKTKEDHSATFSGEIWVSGTLIAEWIGGTGQGAYRTPDYVLIPDAKSKKKLPYFTIKDPPYFLRYPVRTIEIENGRQAITLAAGAEKADLLLSKKTKVLRVTGAFLLEKYSVGVECDAPWARASIREVDIPDPAKIAKVAAPEGC